MKYIIFFLVPAILILGSACSKSDAVSKSITSEMLHGVKWETISIITKQDPSSPETDIFSTLPEFQKDDYFIFSADSTYELNDNEILRSDTAIRIIDAGNWSIQKRNDGHFLEMISNTFTAEYQPAKILELDETNLLLERIFPSDQSIIRTRLRAVK